MAKKKPAVAPTYSSSQLCEAIEFQDEVALAAARLSTDPLVNAKLQRLIHDQLEELLAVKTKSATVQNRVSKRLTSLVDTLVGKKDLKTESLLSDLFEARNKIAKTQGKDPKHDVNFAVMQAMASGSETSAGEMLSKLDEYDTDTFHWATTLALRFCSKEKVFDTFHDWVAPMPETPKRKSAKAKSESVTELLDLYQSGVLYAHGYAPESVADDDPNHVDRVLPTDRLDPRWLETAIQIENLDLVSSLTYPGHKPTQEWAEKRLFNVIKDGKKSKVRASKFVGLLIASEHPERIELHEQAIEFFLKKKDAWEVAICLEMIPQLPKSSSTRLEAIALPSELSEMRDQFVSQLKNNA